MSNASDFEALRAGLCLRCCCRGTCTACYLGACSARRCTTCMGNGRSWLFCDTLSAASVSACRTDISHVRPIIRRGGFSSINPYVALLIRKLS